MKVKLVAAFQGIKMIPSPFAFGGNNLNPKLILHENEIEYKSVFTTNRKKYSDIQEIDIFLNKIKVFSVTTTNIVIVFNNSIFTFIGNTNSLEKLRELVLVFKSKGCNLSSKALDFVAS